MPEPPTVEIDSDSDDSVVITGPIPDYPELRKNLRSTSAPKKRKRCRDSDDVSYDEKVEKIQELEDLVNAVGPISRDTEPREDDDDTWSGSDTKSTRGKLDRHSSSRYLKKIKTLQQNKRRQETRIAKLSREVKSLRDKNSVQAAYIDVLCGMLGDEMKEKFRGKQGLGILGNLKTTDENFDVGPSEDFNENAAWKPIKVNDDCNVTGKDTEYYCVEDLDEMNEESTKSIVNEDSDADGKTEHEEPAQPSSEMMPTDRQQTTESEKNIQYVVSPPTNFMTSTTHNSVCDGNDVTNTENRNDQTSKQNVQDTTVATFSADSLQAHASPPPGDGLIPHQPKDECIATSEKRCDVKNHTEDNEIDCEKFLEQTLNEIEQCSDKFNETVAPKYETNFKFEDVFEDPEYENLAHEDYFQYYPTMVAQSQENGENLRNQATGTNRHAIDPVVNDSVPENPLFLYDVDESRQNNIKYET